MACRILPGLRAVAAEYDLFILDLWGVIHNGVALYDGAAAALDGLRTAGKTVIFLTNAPRRVAILEEQLVAFGVDRACWRTTVSSGEEVRRHLAERPERWYSALGRRCFRLGAQRHMDLAAGTGVAFVDSPAVAEFVLATGPHAGSDNLDVYEDLLAEFRSHDLPMICANPDQVVDQGEVRHLCAGSIAERYVEIGGEVRWHGKPCVEIYRRCLELAGGRDDSRVLCIGDSWTTDIRGAEAAGYESLLVGSGLYADALLDDAGEIDAGKLARAAAAAGTVSTYAMSRLAW